MLYNLSIFCLGIISHILLFYKIRFLRDECNNNHSNKISIVIPARNEESNIGKLISSIKQQTILPFEIICVNDSSTDNTATIIKSFEDVILINIQKDKNWLNGKSYACQCGANVASGDLILFLDADVSLKKNALQKLSNAYNNYNQTISILPYHDIKSPHEQLNLFFNLMQVISTGMSFAFDIRNAGLFGPVILIPKETYIQIGGHTCAKDSIIDDVVLGQKLRKEKHNFKLLLGKNIINFRMYPDKYIDLVRGFEKNFSSGAVFTAKPILLLSFIWVTAITLIPLALINSIIHLNVIHTLLYFICYILFFIIIKTISKQIGNFKIVSVLFYPVFIFFFIIVFFMSLIKKILNLPVKWKDRAIKLKK